MYIHSIVSFYYRLISNNINEMKEITLIISLQWHLSKGGCSKQQVNSQFSE